MNLKSKIIIPGAAGLVGQNLIIQLKNKGYKNIVAIDKHPENTEVLRNLHPDIKIIESDLSQSGKWEDEFENADIVLMLQAQIGAQDIAPFIKNNIDSTQLILNVIKKKLSFHPLIGNDETLFSSL